MMKNVEQIRPSSRRGASSGWNRFERLKPVRNELEAYGLPSKGEMRLNDYAIQQAYFQQIIERYMRICALNQRDLDKLFLSVSDAINVQNSTALGLPLSTSTTGASLSVQAPQHSITELSTILAALRKLREALTATGRDDHFARNVYVFAAHASILCQDWESYLPALNALLTTVLPQLTPSEMHEFVGLLILHQACSERDLVGARETRMRYGYNDRRVELVLKALVEDNWVLFWQMKKAVDGYQRNIMNFAEKGVRTHAMKCLGRAYMSADKAYVERCAQFPWAALVAEGCGWELTDTDKVLIKKPKAN